MSYVTVSRGHDAEWLLQQERQFNDIIVASERRRPGKKRDRGNQAGMIAHPNTAAEELAAEAVVRQVVARLGWGEQGLAEVLEALGLEPTPAVTRRPTVVCPTCGRSLKLLIDRSLPNHSRDLTLKAGDQPCPASGTTHTPEATS